MKKTLLFAFCTLIVTIAKPQCTPGTAFDYLDINNIKAGINSAGDLFWDLSSPQFEVPKGSGTHTIGAGNLWIGGYDVNNNLRLAAQTYRQTGNDFWPGPLNPATATTDASTCLTYDRFWKLNQCDIDKYKNWALGPQTVPKPVDPATATIIETWPAYGPDGVQTLAPYYDASPDGSYDPLDGDYPLIKGDQAIFFIYNDKGNVHTATINSQSMGVEIQVMAYAYGCPDSALQNTIFVNYRIINRSSDTYNNTYIGSWTDLDIGNGMDDYTGCDVARGAYYGYNGDNNDSLYGNQPPAQGVLFLNGPYADPNGLDDNTTATANGTNYGDNIIDNERLGMERFMTYENIEYSGSGPTNSYPYLAMEYYNYLSGYWRFGGAITYGGDGVGPGTPCRYMFPGNTDPLGFGTNMTPQAPWDEPAELNIPRDRVGLGSSGPFTFSPGAVQEVEIAYVFGRDYINTGNIAGVNVMKSRIDSIRSKYNNGISGCGCSALTGINNYSLPVNNLLVYPNPVSDLLHIDYTSASRNNVVIEVLDATGKVLKQTTTNSVKFNSLDISELTKGLYYIKINDGNNIIAQRFIKQ